MANIRIRFHESLADLLPKSRRTQPLSLRLERRASVMDLIESLGVPHTEVGRVTVNGDPVDFSAPVRDGDSIEVGPALTGRGEAIPPDPIPRFVLDVHLGRLARLLRLLGFDALYRNDWGDPELARIADSEGRILLTRDRQLLKRRMVRRGYCVRDDRPRNQAREVLDRFGIRSAARPWSRCLRCNGEILGVESSEVWHLLEPKTRLYYDRFFRCRDCGRVYWEGSHQPVLRGILEDLGAPLRPKGNPD